MSEPIFIQFKKYLHNFFYGNWGESHIAKPGEITKTMKTIVPVFIENSMIAWEWAIFWPGMYIFIISLSLILLHEGLEAPSTQHEVLNTSAISS